MRSSLQRARAGMAAAAAAAVIASAVVVIPVQAARADPASPDPVSETALPTAQVNGVVWSQAVSKGVVYVGGSFNQSQSAGAPSGGSFDWRSNLFAYDVSTGEAVSGFRARTNAQVRGVAASVDGSRIYIVGSFTEVNGEKRNRVAALDRSGELIPDFAPDVNSQVNAVAVRGDRVLIGGKFTAVDGQTRAKAASLTTSGALTSFAPKVSGGDVRAIAASPDGSTVLVGGNFTSTGGVSTRGLAATSAADGAARSWDVNSLITNHGADSSIFSLSTRGDVVYATGYVYNGLENGNLEGAVAMRWSSGDTVWVEDCHGDTYSSVPFNDALYTASHAHDCDRIDGGFPEETPKRFHRALAFSQAATGELDHNEADGYFDFDGRRAPHILDGWAPEFNTGDYTGSSQGPWSVAAGDGYVVYGGEFTKVDGERQTGLVRFKGREEKPEPMVDPVDLDDEPGPPARVSKPDAIGLGPARVAVRWTPPAHAAADGVTKYVIRVVRKGRTVKKTSVPATRSHVVFKGLTNSTVYRVAVTARNDAGQGKRSALDTARTASKGPNLSATKVPGAVKRPTAKADTKEVAVRWTAAPTARALPVVGYQVRAVSGRGDTEVRSVAAARRDAVVKKLKRDTRYVVAVRAKNWAGWGDWSRGRTARTR